MLAQGRPFDAPNACLHRACRDACVELVEIPVSCSSRSSGHPIQVLLFARLLAEHIASKGRPQLSQMINLLPRNRICSAFISTPVNVRLALSPPRSPPFLPNKFLLNADRRLRTPKRQSSALSSRLRISRSGARHAKTSSYPTKSFRRAPSISILRKSRFAVPTSSQASLSLFTFD